MPEEKNDKQLFKTKEIHIDTLGAYLSQIREKLNFDIKTVSILTQIKPKYLESLEKSEWELLPSDVYVRGFIKSLAHVYNQDEKVLIEQYEKEFGFTPKARPKIQTKKQFNFTPKTIIVLVSLFLGVLAV
ncbi:MAG: helix-turn-helix domain-containing protein, partial [Candidatus Doudnabacteria bacterium]|nr:helix-turn-helix domain-containing protein [Candidatus Doudnabacteria bacterium]